MFHRLGDYKHKQRNRLKFLVRSLGWDAFKAEFDKELEAFRLEGGARLPFDPERPPVEEAPEARADGAVGRRHRAVGHAGEGQRARDRSPCRARPTG